MSEAINQECALEGWAEIGKMFGMAKSTMSMRRKELLECGVIFYILKGRPPKRHKRVCAFPSMLRMWAQKKSVSGGKL